MKFTVTFKTPDVTSDALAEYSLADGDEWTQDEMMQVMEKWIKWGENITIEFDTVTGTAEVMPA